MAAQFEIRQHRLDAARKILGMALGICPKDKIFNSYITLELQLGQFERCRQLYAKYLEWRPENCRAWCKWVELEQSLGEVERCRAMYELAIQMPVLDMPEVLWKVKFCTLLPHLFHILVCMQPVCSEDLTNFSVVTLLAPQFPLQLLPILSLTCFPLCMLHGGH